MVKLPVKLLGDAALSVIYKHSSRCWISTKAERQVREFAAEHPEVPVYQLDAVEGRDLAREVAGRLGVDYAYEESTLEGFDDGHKFSLKLTW